MKLHLKINIFSYKAVKYGGGPDALDGRSHRVKANLKRSSTRYHLCQSGSTGSSKLECFQRICFFFKNPIFKKESDGIINSRCAVAQVYGVGTIVFRKWRVFTPALMNWDGENKYFGCAKFIFEATWSILYMFPDVAILRLTFVPLYICVIAYLYICIFVTQNICDPVYDHNRYCDECWRLSVLLLSYQNKYMCIMC